MAVAVLAQFLQVASAQRNRRGSIMINGRVELRVCLQYTHESSTYHLRSTRFSCARRNGRTYS